MNLFRRRDDAARLYADIVCTGISTAIEDTDQALTHVMNHVNKRNPYCTLDTLCIEAEERLGAVIWTNHGKYVRDVIKTAIQTDRENRHLHAIRLESNMRKLRGGGKRLHAPMPRTWAFGVTEAGDFYGPDLIRIHADQINCTTHEFIKDIKMQEHTHENMPTNGSATTSHVEVTMIGTVEPEAAQSEGQEPVAGIGRNPSHTHRLVSVGAEYKTALAELRTAEERVSSLRSEGALELDAAERFRVATGQVLLDAIHSFNKGGLYATTPAVDLIDCLLKQFTIPDPKSWADAANYIMFLWDLGVDPTEVAARLRTQAECEVAEARATVASKYELEMSSLSDEAKKFHKKLADDAHNLKYRANTLIAHMFAVFGAGQGLIDSVQANVSDVSADRASIMYALNDFDTLFKNWEKQNMLAVQPWTVEHRAAFTGLLQAAGFNDGVIGQVSQNFFNTSCDAIMKAHDDGVDVFRGIADELQDICVDRDIQASNAKDLAKKLEAADTTNKVLMEQNEAFGNIIESNKADLERLLKENGELGGSVAKFNRERIHADHVARLLMKALGMSATAQESMMSLSDLTNPDYMKIRETVEKAVLDHVESARVPGVRSSGVIAAALKQFDESQDQAQHKYIIPGWYLLRFEESCDGSWVKASAMFVRQDGHHQRIKHTHDGIKTTPHALWDILRNRIDEGRIGSGNSSEVLYSGCGQTEAKPTRQYYWRTNGCPTMDSKDPECKCWHDEGTGPRPNGPMIDGVKLVWRDKPNTEAREIDPGHVRKSETVQINVSVNADAAGDNFAEGVKRALEGSIIDIDIQESYIAISKDWVSKPRTELTMTFKHKLSGETVQVVGTSEVNCWWQLQQRVKMFPPVV